MLSLGLMSGTSCDGMSAALAEFRGRQLRVIASSTTRYPSSLRQQLLHAGTLHTPDIARLHVLLGERFAHAALRLLRRAGVARRTIRVIGSHGHTVYHGPRDVPPCTLQLGAPAVIAHRTRIPVVADFRARDVAAGGEGAPLVPYFDVWRFGHGRARAVQNIGGIANITIVGARIAPVAFDTGPGNCLMDLVAARISKGRYQYDPQGRMAAQGRIDPRAIRRLWQQPFFRRPPPKSTGRELFNDALLRQVFGNQLRRQPYDVLATVTYFTAWSIAQSLRRYAPRPIHEIVVSGGGVYNRTLMEHLQQLLTPIPVRSIASYGIPPLAKEPVTFALLASRAIRGLPNHLPETTGAQSRCVLGTITRA